MDYKIGDKVVYPNHGVGLVEQISYGILNGRTERYFMIRIVSSGLRVMVPQSNALAVGLRSVIRSAESTKVLGFLETGKLNSHHDWKHRFKENSERMRTGSLLEVAVVEPGKRRSDRCEVARQSQAAVPHHDRKIRIVFSASLGAFLSRRATPVVRLFLFGGVTPAADGCSMRGIVPGPAKNAQFPHKAGAS